jgi:hypothetical protein
LIQSHGQQEKAALALPQTEQGQRWQGRQVGVPLFFAAPHLVATTVDWKSLFNGKYFTASEDGHCFIV